MEVLLRHDKRLVVTVLAALEALDCVYDDVRK